jgi:16S rRNA G527 N7-methylase RsmG
VLYSGNKEEFRDLINDYICELTKWNKKIRLTGYKDETQIREKLIEANIKAVREADLKGDGADIGSGNGSLMIAIKAIYPQLKIYCVERTKKKAAIIEKIIKQLKIHNVYVIAEDLITMEPKYQWDWVIMREVKLDKKLITAIKKQTTQNAKIYIITSACKAEKLKQSDLLDIKHIVKITENLSLIKAQCFM